MQSQGIIRYVLDIHSGHIDKDSLVRGSAIDRFDLQCMCVQLWFTMAGSRDQ